MRIGVPKETAAGEHRVALVPEVVSKLEAKGLDIVVQNGAGDDALVPDQAFADAGAQLSGDAAAIWSCDVVLTIAPPPCLIICGIAYLQPSKGPRTITSCVRAKIATGSSPIDGSIFYSSFSIKMRL